MDLEKMILSKIIGSQPLLYNEKREQLNWLLI